jgi:hypothetical protein
VTRRERAKTRTLEVKIFENMVAFLIDERDDDTKRVEGMDAIKA